MGLHFTVGLIGLVAMAWLFGAITQDIFAQDPLVAIDQRVAAFIPQHHTSALDSIASVIAFLSSSWWMLFLIAVVVAGSALAGDLSLSITSAAVLAGAYGLALGLQSVFSTFSPQVPPIELVIHGFNGFPSVTVTTANAAYEMAFYSFVVQRQSWRLQTLGAVVTVYAILLIGLDTLYAGQLLSAAIGGFALGGCSLGICITASHHLSATAQYQSLGTYRMERACFSVTLMDGRRRIGGRNWTLRHGDKVEMRGEVGQIVGFSKGTYLNAGPARIPQPPPWFLSRRIESRLLPAVAPVRHLCAPVFAASSPHNLGGGRETPDFARVFAHRAIA